MASFEDLAFDWATLCQDCPECWTTSVLAIPFSYGGHVSYCMLSLPKSSETPALCESHYRPNSMGLIEKETPYTEVDYTDDCVEECQLTIRTVAPRNGSNGNICYLKSPMSTQLAFFGLNPRSVHQWSSMKMSLRKKHKSKKKRISYTYYDDSVKWTLDDMEDAKMWFFHG